MKHLLLAAIDRLMVALLAAVIVIAVLTMAAPWEQSIQAAIDNHRLEPIDSYHTSVLVRTVTPGGVEVLPPYEIPMWQYVQLPQERLDARIVSFESVSEALLTDPEMRGHLIRHGVTENELDVMLSKLGD